MEWGALNKNNDNDDDDDAPHLYMRWYELMVNRADYFQTHWAKINSIM